MTQPASPTSTMFAVASAYDQLMGRYLPQLGAAFADRAGVAAGMTALDVGCGPGGLTQVLADRLGPAHVAAIDPSPPFVEACRARNPGVDVRVGVAEQLPFADGSFDVALASLVVAFMSDAAAGVAEMHRVTRHGGTLALCFWNPPHMPTIRTFWRAAAQVVPGSPGEANRLGTHQGDLVGLLEATGATEVEESTLTASTTYADFEDWWAPFAAGVGPAGAFCRSLPEDTREAVRSAALALLGQPNGPFTVEAEAWCAVGIA